jgi:hypothetical protein
MPPKLCCCNPEGCLIHEDAFDRADSTTIGDPWVEEVGDWEIVSGKLNIDEIGLIRNTTANLYGTANSNVWATIEDYEPGKKYRLIIQLNEDADDYYYAEWHYVDSMNMYWTLGDQSGAIETQGPFLPTEEGAVIKLFMHERNQLCMHDDQSRITICVPPKSGQFVGLASGSADGATFDNFLWQATPIDDVTCPNCDCSCDYWCIPDALLASFVDANECPLLDGLTALLQNNGPTKFGYPWVQSVALNCPDGSGGQFVLRFECSNLTEIKGYLTFDVAPPTLQNPNISYEADPTVSTCNPLSLRFGPFDLGAVSGCNISECCGGTPCGLTPTDTSLVYIWITEAGSSYDY